MKYALLLLTLFTLSLCTSQENLSNDSALELISEKFEKKCYGNISTIFASNWRNYDELKSFWENHQSDNLVTIKAGNVAAGGFNQSVYQMRITPTQATRSEFMQKSKFLQTEGEVDKIIGISINEAEKTATVKYEYRIKMTPFYPTPGIKTKCSLEPQQATATLKLYDTGWQVESVEESPYAKLLGQ